MDEIEQYYNQRVAQSRDPFWQVGKTVNGQAVGTEQLDLICDSIVSALSLTFNDNVLDIGCGNGLVTRKIAEQVKSIIGIERNQALFEQAVRHKCGQNQLYINSDVFSFDSNSTHADKVYLYEVIQHVSHQQVTGFLRHISSFMGSEQKIFIGGVPDEERKWDFYNTPERREGLFRHMTETGNDPVGYWFHREEFQFLARELGMQAKIMDQPSELYTSHYRFNCLLFKS